MTQLLEVGNFRHFDFDGGKALVKKTQWESYLTWRRGASNCVISTNHPPVDLLWDLEILLL